LQDSREQLSCTSFGAWKGLTQIPLPSPLPRYLSFLIRVMIAIAATIIICECAQVHRIACSLQHFVRGRSLARQGNRITLRGGILPSPHHAYRNGGKKGHQPRPNFQSWPGARRKYICPSIHSVIVAGFRLWAPSADRRHGPMEGLGWRLGV
jgi:hypothetical protein